MSIPVVVQLEVRTQNNRSYLCQRARPAVVSSLVFQASFVSRGSPSPNTVLLRSSKNCCAYCSSSFRSAAACALLEVFPELREVEALAGVVGRSGALVRFFGTTSRDDVPATRGVILIGFFAECGGLLK